MKVGQLIRRMEKMSREASILISIEGIEASIDWVCHEPSTILLMIGEIDPYRSVGEILDRLSSVEEDRELLVYDCIEGRGYVYPVHDVRPDEDEEGRVVMPVSRRERHPGEGEGKRIKRWA